MLTIALLSHTGVRVLNPFTTTSLAISLCCGSFATGQTASSTTTKASGSDWKQVEAAMGRPGQIQPGDVIKFGMPRKDLHVTLDGVEIKAGLALGSGAAFKQESGSAMEMGDLVLTEDEVEPVMVKMLEGGIHESANHKHMNGESPYALNM